MKWKVAVLASVVMSASAGGCSASTTPAQPEPCAEGKGTWVQDDNGWLEETRVTVRLCLDEAGRVLAMEVN